MQHSVKFIASLLLLCSVCLLAFGCQTVPTEQPKDSDTATATPVVDPVPPDTTETTPPASDDTTVPYTTEPPVTDPVTSEPETSAPETEASAEPEVPEEPAIIHPLTGLTTDTDLSAKRPAAIMINNIRVSCPQDGIIYADIIYECLVEGGLTRLMMITLDYDNLPEIGSIRSSRDYYLNFAADFDALYIHAGGSPFAYDSIKARKIQNLDGVNMWNIPAKTFYRSPERMKTMSLEHCLVSTGEKIAAAVKYKKYRTDLAENFDYPLDFVKPGETVAFADKAENIHIPFSISQVTDFTYDAETGEYLRYQFNGQKHIEGTTGEQLTFKNVMILFCKTGAITGDVKNRIDVTTVGEGSGYYAVNGTYTKIKWVKDSDESPIRFYGEDGELLMMNPGKTFISVCPTSIESIVSMNYKK